MKRSSMLGAMVLLSGTNMCVAGLSGGAPSSAQVWDVRWVVDSAGAFAASPSATAVGITLMARVGILPNTTSSGTANFGVRRVGGSGSATSGFRVIFTDPVSAAAGLNQGSVQPGHTGDVRTLDPVTGAFSPTGVPTILRDTEGELLAGHFAPFRGSFNPQSGPLFVGSNTDPGNGSLFNPATGTPILANLIGTRAANNIQSDGLGPLGAAETPTSSDPLSLVGDLTAVYRLVFFPSAGGERTIIVNTSGATARYNFTLGNTIAIAQTAIRNQQIEFLVPAPGGATLGVLGICACARRRRSTRFQRCDPQGRHS